VYGGDSKDGGLNRMDKKTGRFTRYLHDPKDPNSLVDNKVKALFEDSKGNLWVGTSGDGLHTMDRTRGTFTRYPHDPAHPEKLSRPPFKPKPFFDHITFITEDITGGIWIGTAESGLNYYDPVTRRTTHYESERDTAGAFTDQLPWCAYTSREGVLWISTTDGNLYRVTPQRRDIARQQAEAGIVTSFYEEGDGTLWIGSQKGLLVQSGAGGSQAKRFVHDADDPASLSSDFVNSIVKDRKGKMWIGTDGGLDVWNKNTGGFVHYRNNLKDNRSLSSNVVIRLYEDKKADLWIGTLKGLNRLNSEAGTFTHYFFHPEDTTTMGLNLVSSIMEDKRDHFWVSCAMAGDVHLLNRENGTFKTYLKSKGIVSLFEDSNGRLWASGMEGLFLYDRAKNDFTPYADPGTQAPFSYVRSIVEDGQKNLWLGTESGLLKLNSQGVLVRRYSQPYGINGILLSYGSGYKRKNGQLLFGSTSGYFSFFPEKLPQNVPPPQIVYSNFRLLGRPWERDTMGPVKQPLWQLRTLKLNHDQNAFSFDFAAIDFINPEENRHYFKLENYDPDWNRAGSDRRAVYFNVPPGKYVLHVKAANSSGVWSEKSMNITIVPPWWNTWWFRIPAVILAVGLFYGVIRWRTQYKLKLQLERSNKEKQLADLANKAMELEMKALRAQMNPHFIFNSLNAINRFILQNNKAQASEYLTKFSRLVRLTLQNSQAALISLESELEALQLYLELEAVRFEQRFEFAVHVDKEIDDVMLKVPPLIIQPFAENAIWHGLMHKEEKGRLTIEIFEKGDALYYKITDDGIGRKKAAELKSGSANTHRSMGMQITADRITYCSNKNLLILPFRLPTWCFPTAQPAVQEVVLKLPVIYD
jgi:hypothetical protein